MQKEEVMFCLFCGTHNPEFITVDYTRECQSCIDGVVVSSYEVIDLINSLKSKGLITEDMLSCVSDEDYERKELDFDDDILSIEEAIARDDALRDMYDY
jgi:hypothetical protein